MGAWGRWAGAEAAGGSRGRVIVSRVCSAFSGDTHLLSPVPRPGRLSRREPLRVRPALRGGREKLLRYGGAGLEGWRAGGRNNRGPSAVLG